ncbi:tetratricopeptide repeat protein, partial [Acinetobacter baumannii]
GVPNFAVQALTYRLRLNDLEGARSFLASLTPQQNAALEKYVPFLSVRSSVKQLQRDLEGARADMRLALSLAPRAADVRAETLWVLI